MRLIWEQYLNWDSINASISVLRLLKDVKLAMRLKACIARFITNGRNMLFKTEF